MYPQSMFLAKIRKLSNFFLLKIFILYNLKILCILHGHVFVMEREKSHIDNQVHDDSRSCIIFHFTKSKTDKNNKIKQLQTCNLAFSYFKAR